MPNPYYNNIRTNIPFSIADGNSIDNDFDGITSGFAMVSSDVTRAIKLPVGTLTDQVIIGSASARADKALAFDANGALILDPSARSQAGIATTQAGIATTQAGIASLLVNSLPNYTAPTDLGLLSIPNISFTNDLGVL